MASAALKRKNDRLFCPYKYTREMEFYLETRGMKLSDIYDEEEEENDDIEEVQVKLESEVGEDEEEMEEELEDEKEDEKEDENEDEKEDEKEEEIKVAEPAPKNKKNKIADTSITYRSARLREKQTALEKSSPEKKTSTPINTKQKPIKVTPASKNLSVSHSLSGNSSSKDVTETVEANKEDDHHLSYNYTPQPKKPKISIAANNSVNHTPNNNHPPPLTFANESEAADQAFFDSIKPALRKMNETQKLDFQIDILQVLKTFRNN